MKRAIINADDFGLSPGVNEGIIKAHRDGILTSATILANMPAFEYALELAKSNPNLGIGLHLNIVRGKPVSDVSEVLTLINPETGGFWNLSDLAFRLFLKKISLADVEREYRAQFEKALSLGLRITHVDGEKHHHFLPPLLKVALRLAKEYDIQKARNILKAEWTLEGLARLAGRSSLSFLGFFVTKPSIRSVIKKSEIACPEHFFGLFETGDMTAARYRRIFEDLPDGTSEIMCHPGYRDVDLEIAPQQMGDFYINKYREIELEGLCAPDLRDLAKSKDIRLISFAELKEEHKK